MRAILTYHSLDESGSPISLSRDTFQTHCAFFRGGRVRVLDLDALLAAAESDHDAVAITFDDGFLNARDALLHLSDTGLPASVFVVTTHAGGTNAWGGQTVPNIPVLPLMGWSDLEQLAARGVGIRSHTRRHPDLTAVSATELDDELLGSREDLHARLGIETDHLAYPYGDVNDIVAARASVHYSHAYTTQFKLLTAADAPARIPRIDMYYFRGAGTIETWGSAAFTRRVAWIQNRRRLRVRLLAASHAMRRRRRPGRKGPRP